MDRAGPTIERVRRLRRLRRGLDASRSKRGVAVLPERLLDAVPAMSPELFAPMHLAPIAEQIERIDQGEQIELCISVGPRHGKTSLLICAIVWLLVRDPTRKILFVSYAHGFAAKQARKAMRLAQAVGLGLGDMQRRDEWNTAHGGGLKATGRTGQLTGEGFDVIFVDDPHKNRAEAESRLIRESVVESFRDDIYTRQSPRGTSVIVCHTRWHEQDLIGVLTRPVPSDQDDQAKPFRSIVLKAINEYGEALAPALFPIDRLLRIKARIGEYAWASLYQGSPRPRSGALFADAALCESLPPSRSSAYAIGVDLAHTTHTRSDYQAAVVLRLDHATGSIHVAEVVRKQGVLTDRQSGGEIDMGFARDIAALQQRYAGARCVQYTGGSEGLVLEMLASLEKHSCYVEAWPNRARDKWTRAQPYAAAWNDGRILIPRRAVWASDFVLEHAGFTGLKGDRDDQVDAAAAAFDALMSSAGVAVEGLADRDERGSGRRGRRAARLYT